MENISFHVLYKITLILLIFYRKNIQSESPDDDTTRENEENAVSDSSAVKDAETKVCESSIQGDQEQVDSSTNEPLTEVKEEGKDKTGDDAPEEEKKDENAEATTATENASSSKKKPARKRSSAGKGSGGKSSRSSK